MKASQDRGGTTCLTFPTARGRLFLSHTAGPSPARSPSHTPRMAPRSRCHQGPAPPPPFLRETVGFRFKNPTAKPGSRPPEGCGTGGGPGRCGGARPLSAPRRRPAPPPLSPALPPAVISAARGAPCRPNPAPQLREGPAGPSASAPAPAGPARAARPRCSHTAGPAPPFHAHGAVSTYCLVRLLHLRQLQCLQRERAALRSDSGLCPASHGARPGRLHRCPPARGRVRNGRPRRIPVPSAALRGAPGRPAGSGRAASTPSRAAAPSQPSWGPRGTPRSVPLPVPGSSGHSGAVHHRLRGRGVLGPTDTPHDAAHGAPVPL